MRRDALHRLVVGTATALAAMRAYRMGVAAAAGPARAVASARTRPK
ncbi:hypothetical protein [Micromonospora sp. NBC_01412]